MVLIVKTPEVFDVTDASSPQTGHNLGSLAQIPPGEGRRFELNGTAVAVFHSRNGQVFATQGECPHRAGPLADGLIGDATLICPLHSFKFSLNTGEPLGNDCSALQTFPVAVNQAGEIIIEPVP